MDISLELYFPTSDVVSNYSASWHVYSLFRRGCQHSPTVIFLSSHLPAPSRLIGPSFNKADYLWWLPFAKVHLGDPCKLWSSASSGDTICLPSKWYHSHRPHCPLTFTPSDSVSAGLTRPIASLSQCLPVQLHVFLVPNVLRSFSWDKRWINLQIKSENLLF